jgi:hypothetical protein
MFWYSATVRDHLSQLNRQNLNVTAWMWETCCVFPPQGFGHLSAEARGDPCGALQRFKYGPNRPAFVVGCARIALVFTMSSGLLMLYFELQPSRSTSDLESCLNVIRFEIPSVSNIAKLRATDKLESHKPYRWQLLTELDDVDSVSSRHLELAREQTNHVFCRSEWHLLRRISFDHQSWVTGKERPEGAELIQVGMAPIERPEILEDYHAWYNTAHMPGLAKVKGWTTGTRYQLIASTGDGAEPAEPYLAQHLYAKDNGLGGPEWRETVENPWTKKVVSNLSQPSHRRAWEIVA